MTVRHCLDCDVLVINDSRCRKCNRARIRLSSALGRQRRGNNWGRASQRLKQRWKDEGFGCAMSHLGNCKGRIQADHLDIPGLYQPLCAFHNNQKH